MWPGKFQLPRGQHEAASAPGSPKEPHALPRSCFLPDNHSWQLLDCGCPAEVRGLSSGDQGHPQAPMWAGEDRGRVAAGTPEQVDAMGLYPGPKHPWALGSITHLPGVLRMKSSVWAAAPGRWLRVPLWGCKAACNWCRGGLSAPVGTAVLVGDTLACQGLAEASWPSTGTSNATDPCLVPFPWLGWVRRQRGKTLEWVLMDSRPDASAE